MVGLRISGKRELAQLNPFDLIVLLMLSNTVQNAIIGDDNSVTGGVIGAITLLAVNYLIVRSVYSSPKLQRLFGGEPEVLVRNGQVRLRKLERELITKEELEAAAHRQGIASLRMWRSASSSRPARSRSSSAGRRVKMRDSKRLIADWTR